MEDQTGVTSDPSTDTGSQPAPEQVEVVAEPQVQKPPKGFVPYQALEEERSKRKELEAQLANAAPSEEPEVYSDEGKILRDELKGLNDKLRSIERKEQRREAEAQFPVLKERSQDFDEFLEDDENKRLSLGKAAKLFLAEQNLLAPEPPIRAGVEKPSGGGQTPPEPKYSPEERLHMMQNDYDKYEKLLRAGKI
jgi:hypothetical protein